MNEKCFPFYKVAHYLVKWKTFFCLPVVSYVRTGNLTIPVTGKHVTYPALITLTLTCT